MMTPTQFNRIQLNRLRRLLCSLQDSTREALIAARRRQRSALGFSKVAAVTEADTIYAIDRVSEAAITDWFEQHWPAKEWPVQVVMEGIEDDTPLTFPKGTPVTRTILKVILDPIDGTRGIMYDKRSAWALAGAAPQRGARTRVDDIFVAAMSELPTSKHAVADQFSAVRGGGLVAERIDLANGKRKRWTPRPSQARDFDHGFASFAKFFPEGKVWLAALEEALWKELGVFGRNGGQLVFDDQYISTGGQLCELIVGHDRMIADIRPLAFERLGLVGALACHPYDICTALLLREAGGVVENPLDSGGGGGGIRAPLDTTTPVSWIAYANPHLARKVRPVLRRLLLAGS
ncbi:inositol monophosphatase [Opitutaceae bacterium TAV4]|nr:inositol monophosphatase [Opitutaceae bacterium TAV4]RRJ94413.1 inositol monophosphatase [Opitutaceae bacterium TAV4]